MKINSTALYKLGCFHLYGLCGTSKNFEAAQNYLLESANSNNGPALALLGFMYEVGRGVPVDLKSSIEYHRRAVENGYKKSMTSIDRLTLQRFI